MYKLILFSLFLFILSSCSKDENCSCKNEITGQSHLVDISKLLQEKELADTLSKYPNLQVYRIIDDQFQVGMHCNMFHKGVLIMSRQYLLSKSKSDGHLFTFEDGIPDPNSINLSLIPLVICKRAIKIAKETINFKRKKIFYQLGIFDANLGKGKSVKDYKLVWRVKDEFSKFVILDAHDETIYRIDDGIITN